MEASPRTTVPADQDLEGNGARPSVEVEPEEVESDFAEDEPQEQVSGELSPREATDALDLMLRSDPPEFPTERINMVKLAERMGVEEFWIELRGLSEPELEQVGRRSERKPTKEEREAGQTRPRDLQRLFALTVAEAMIEPDLRDARMLQAHGPTPLHVVQRWFLPGEIQQLQEVVSELSGFGGEAVERAKK